MLVFWLDAVISIMALFIAVEIRDFIGITHFFFFSDVNSIVASSRDFFWFSSVFLLALKPLLFVFFLSRLRWVIM